MYYYILVLLPFICFLIKNINIKQKYLYYLGFSYIFFFLIIFVSSLRYDVGTDYFSYKEIFELGLTTEPLFAALIKLIKKCHGEYPVFVFIVFMLSLNIKLFIFSKLSYNKGYFLSLMIFCSFYYIAYEMNAVRQGLALSLTMLASFYAIKKEKIKYFITTMCAILTHYTAIIFLPFYYIINQRISKKTALILCTISFILALNNSFSTLINLATLLIGEHDITTKIIAYSTSENFENNILLSFSTIRRLFFFTLILFTYERIEAKTEIKQIIFWGAFISTILYLLFAQVGYFSTRLSVYYRIYECLWISYIPFIFQRKSTKIFITFFFLLYAFSQVASALSLGNNGLTPIKLIIFQDIW